MRQQRIFTVLQSCLLILLLCCSSAFAEEALKKGILIVAFGTSVESGRVSYDNIAKQVKAAFPKHEILWAWTAHSLLKSAAKDAPMLSTQEALAKFATSGVKKVSILSLHVIPGQEYNDLAKNARAFEGLPKGLEEVHLTPPLLYDTESVDNAAKLLLKNLPKTRKADEAVVFVGHGTHHPASVYYPALQYYMSRLDGNAFIGTVEGDLDFEAVSKALKVKGVKKVWLAPLMMVAGDHALNDLFGDEADSWRQQLTAQGMKVEAVAKGLGEYPDIVKQRVEQLRDAGKAPEHKE